MLVRVRQAARLPRARAARERRSRHPAGPSASARRRALHRRRADPARRRPEFGQVRDSNAYTIFGALREAGAQPVLAGIVKDDVDSLKETRARPPDPGRRVHLLGRRCRVGERDVVKAAFFRRGDVDFYKVAMQPGMPQGFGHIEGKPYFGLPGNPVSVFVSFEQFVRPAIMKMMGRTQAATSRDHRHAHRGRQRAEGQAAVRPGPCGARRRGLGRNARPARAAPT